MNGVNKVMILGRLGQDPQDLTTRDGKPYSRLSLATNYYLRNEEGRAEKKTEWHRVTVFGKKAELCKQFLKKGSPVFVEGYLSTYETEDDAGNKKWHTSITANDVTFLPN